MYNIKQLVRYRFRRHNLNHYLWGTTGTEIKRKFIERRVIKVIKELAEQYPEKFNEFAEQLYNKGLNGHHLIYIIYKYMQGKDVTDMQLIRYVNNIYGGEFNDKEIYMGTAELEDIYNKHKR